MLINNCLDKFTNTLHVGDLVTIDITLPNETFTVMEIDGTPEKARLKIRKCIGATPFNIDANKVFWVMSPRLLADEE